MPLPIGLMLGLSGLSSALGQGINAYTTSRGNQMEAQGLARTRAAFAPILNRLMSPNYGSLDRRAIGDLSRASDQITQNRAATGQLDAGRSGGDALISQAAAEILAQLADAKMQADMQREQLIAQINSDPAMTAPDPSQFNPGLDALLGLLGGAAAGAGQGLGTMMGTELGLESLGDWWQDVRAGGGAQQAAAAPRFPLTAGLISRYPSGPGRMTGRGNVRISE